MDFTQIVEETAALGMNLYDLALWQDGEISFWQYVPCNRCNDSYSVAKVYTMTSVGLLFSEGRLSLDARLIDFFPEHLPADMPDAWRRVTVEHALTHRVGFGESTLDIDCEDASQYPQDYLRHLFSMPLAHEPGTESVYTDAAYYLLSRVVGEVAGEPMDQLLYRRILRPLRIQEAAWSRDPQGHPIGATGLYIGAQDMVKLGALYLNGGVYEGKQLLSGSWVARALGHDYELHRMAEGRLYLKHGMYGQGLCFSPDLRFAAAWHACEHGERSRAMAEYFGQLALRLTGEPTQER